MLPRPGNLLRTKDIGLGLGIRVSGYSGIRVFEYILGDHGTLEKKVKSTSTGVISTVRTEMTDITIFFFL